MIYKGLNRIGMIDDIKTNGGGEIAEVYGRIGESNPIYYKQREIIGTSPMQFKALGLPIKDYRIYGETLQDGTPSPEAPVDVQGVGTRTGNLLHEFYATSGELSGNDYTITKNSIETHNDGITLGAYFVLTEFARNGNYANYTKIGEKYSFKIHAGTYIFSANENLYSDYNGLRLIVGQLGQSVVGTTAGAINVGVGQTFTVNVDSYVCPVLEIRSDSHVDRYILTKPMLNLGSTALPYEPYGYKLPVTITNGTDTVSTPIYIGSEPLHRIGEYADYVGYSSGKIMRRIKKLVLTGEETWVEYTSIADCYSLTIRDNPGITGNGICSHYAKAETTLQLTDGTFVSGQNFLYFKDVSTQNLDGWKSYLAAQYTAGTPVTVWYVLSEPIEEDPPISFPELTTLSGTNTLTVDTTIKPSEIDLTGRLKASGYGQILDKNLTAINDSTGTPIFIRG